MFRSLTALVVLSAQLVTAQVTLPALTRAGLVEIGAAARRIDDPRKLTDATQGNQPTAFIHGRCMVGFLGKVNGAFDANAVTSEHIHLGACVGRIVSFRVDAHHLEELTTIPGMEYAELAGKVAPTLDRLVHATHADSVQKGIDLPQTYTGRNVLIGITDWGFDYTHPMFYDTALTTSRVRAAWDQWRQAGPAPSFGYGTELMTPEALMAAQADTANVYSYATHGSHVAGIAGGGGAGTVYRGIAFDAQYVFCTFLVDAAAVLDAFAWMKSVADLDQKRLVVNMSWGLYYMGTLDGNSLISQAINDYAEQGVVFANSAGNNGDVHFHIRKEFASDTLLSRIQIYPYSANPNMWGQSITMWGQPGGSFSAGFSVTNVNNVVVQQSPWYHTTTQAAYMDSFLVQGTDTVFYNLTADAAHPLNGRPYFRLRVKNTHTQLHIVLKATAESGVVHFWNVTELSNGVGNWGQEFLGGPSTWTAGDVNYGISEPACTEGLITVAAYSSEYTTSGGDPAGGQIASFSSFGPTLDERMKPDVTAPGVNVASSISSFTDNDYTAVSLVDFQGRTYPFARFSGTSMASPAVTGIVALMLEADPTISAADVREILRITARTDNQTGVIPPGGSTRWGMGKVNAYRAVIEELGLASVEELASTSLVLWPNPVTNSVNVLADVPAGQLRITATDVTGRNVYLYSGAASATVSIDASAWTPGVYIIRMEQGDRVLTGKVVKQ